MILSDVTNHVIVDINSNLT